MILKYIKGVDIESGEKILEKKMITHCVTNASLCL
jgi:hypothetical protein